jgi:hypothetical protein
MTERPANKMAFNLLPLLKFGAAPATRHTRSRRTSKRGRWDRAPEVV